MNYIKGVTWLILSLIIGCINDAIMKYLGSADISSWQIIFVRYFVATIILVPIIFLKKKTTFKTTSPLLHFIRGTILLIAMLLWNNGLSLVPLSTATLLSFSVPIFILALSPIFLKEKGHIFVWLATIACFIGAAIATNSRSFSLQSSSMILISAELLFATLDILYKKYLSKDSILITIFYSSLIPAALSLIPAFSHNFSISPINITILSILGIGSNLILFCILKAYSYTTATSLAPFRYVELVISIGLGYLFFLEIPDVHMIFGGIIIIGSTLLVSFCSRKN